MKILKVIDLNELNFTTRTSVEKLEEIALKAKTIHQSIFGGGDLQCFLDQMYHFKNGRNYYGGKTLENITALKGLIGMSLAQKFDPFNAVPAILLNLKLPTNRSPAEAISTLSTGQTLNRQLACKKDIYFLSVIDYLPLHNMFALLVGGDLLTLNDGENGKLMTNTEIQRLNAELPYFQLIPVSDKLSDQIMVQITVDDKVLKALNSKLSKVDVGLVYGQYAGLNIERLRQRMLNVA